jgi:hypothetical protein
VERPRCLVKGCPARFASGRHRLCGLHKDEQDVYDARERAQDPDPAAGRLVLDARAKRGLSQTTQASPQPEQVLPGTEPS